MQKSRLGNISAVIVFCFLLNAPAQSQFEYQIPGPTHCGVQKPDDAATQKAKRELEPWFKEFEQQLKQQPEYPKLAEAYKGKKLVCTFTLNPNSTTVKKLNL